MHWQCLCQLRTLLLHPPIYPFFFNSLAHISTPFSFISHRDARSPTPRYCTARNTSSINADAGATAVIFSEATLLQTLGVLLLPRQQ
jgi:hypothetical protein